MAYVTALLLAPGAPRTIIALTFSLPPSHRFFFTFSLLQALFVFVPRFQNTAALAGSLAFAAGVMIYVSMVESKKYLASFNIYIANF